MFNYVSNHLSTFKQIVKSICIKPLAIIREFLYLKFFLFLKKFA